jgi:signal transduction histidine kinase
MPGSIGSELFGSLHPQFVSLVLRFIPYSIAVICLLLFIYEIYGEGRSKKIKYVAIAVTITVNSILSLAGLESTIWRAIIGLPAALLVNGIFLYVLIRSPLLKTDRLSILYLCGFILYIFSGIITVTSINSGPILAVAFNFVFAVIHAILLSNRFARAIRDVEEANLALEDRVAERTLMLSEANESLAASEKNVREMVRNVSHELRTPLTVMSTYAQLAVEQLRKGQMDEQTLEGLAAISAEAQRLAELASNTLAPSGETERLVDIAEIASQLARLLELTATKNQQELNVSLEQSLLTFGNAGEITQVLWNLIDNALKYAGSSSIEIEGNQNDEYVYVIVADYGGGIDPELMPKIFERGVTGGRGQGLGLAISNEIVSRHGGRLILESEVGLGTQVTMLLPAYRPKGGESSG